MRPGYVIAAFLMWAAVLLYLWADLACSSASPC